MIMNKKGFNKELQRKLNYNQEKYRIINDIMESASLIGKKNKDKMISDLMIKLNITNTEANKIYKTSMNIIKEEIRNKIKHPFRSYD